VLLPFVFLAIPISLADIKSYSIPNIYLIWLSFLCVPHVLMQGLGPVPRILFVIAILLVLHLCGLGMGDVKLLGIVALMLNSDPRTAFFNVGFSIALCAVIYAIARTLPNRELPRKIPLAPSIFIGLALYLATR
jgi:Flp pilus assembly protein protease CpaA